MEDLSAMRFPTFCTTLLCLVASSAALAAPPPKYPTRLPPPAELDYGIKARQSGLSLNGEATMRWDHASQSYTIGVTTRAMLVGKILEEKSEGGIDAWGLAPARFTEQRYRKGATSVSFDRAARKISFEASERSYPIQGGEQDHASVVWQLSSVARAAPAKFKAGSSWNFFVVGQRDGDPWTFRVVGQEKVNGPSGPTTAWHVTRNPPPDAKGRQLDIWLAPDLQWYPVKLRYTESDGDYIEQTLREVRSQPAK
jgi:hypothetical protein